MKLRSNRVLVYTQKGTPGRIMLARLCTTGYSLFADETTRPPRCTVTHEAYVAFKWQELSVEQQHFYDRRAEQEHAKAKGFNNFINVCYLGRTIEKNIARAVRDWDRLTPKAQQEWTVVAVPNAWKYHEYEE
jgi:hypothetical protein